MAYEKKAGQFSLFKNKFHEKGDNKPTMRGDGICPCCEKTIELAVWSKQDRDGNPFFSGKMQEPQAKSAPQPAAAPRKPARDDIDDEIPF